MASAGTWRRCRHSHRITITEKGVALLRKSYPAWQKAQNLVAHRLGPDGVAALKAVVGGYAAEVITPQSVSVASRSSRPSLRGIRFECRCPVIDKSNLGEVASGLVGQLTAGCLPATGCAIDIFCRDFGICREFGTIAAWSSASLRRFLMARLLRLVSASQSSSSWTTQRSTQRNRRGTNGKNIQSTRDRICQCYRLSTRRPGRRPP
jgi:hypothetical protein